MTLVTDTYFSYQGERKLWDDIVHLDTMGFHLTTDKMEQDVVEIILFHLKNKFSNYVNGLIMKPIIDIYIDVVENEMRNIISLHYKGEKMIVKPYSIPTGVVEYNRHSSFNVLVECLAVNAGICHSKTLNNSKLLENDTVVDYIYTLCGGDFHPTEIGRMITVFNYMSYNLGDKWESSEFGRCLPNTFIVEI